MFQPFGGIEAWHPRAIRVVAKQEHVGHNELIAAAAALPTVRIEAAKLLMDVFKTGAPFLEKGAPRGQEPAQMGACQ